MDIVRSLLAGQALKWANRRVAELNALGHSSEWLHIRADFIDAHLGDSTVETFKAEMRALRLGTGEEQCKTPSELATQFDRLAELAYPMALGLTDRRADAAMATVLGDEYRRIVAESNQYLWKNIERNVAPTTLDEWKAALARYWAAERNIENMQKQRPQQSSKEQHQQQQGGRGGGAGRGGRGRGGGSSGYSSNQASASAAQDTDEREEGEPEPQASAATVSGRGGGRGGRGGGRGGGGGRQMSPDVQKLYNEGRCFRCGGMGHRAAECTTKAAPAQQQQQQQQGKGQAE
jgi:hypothetical protein